MVDYGGSSDAGGVDGSNDTAVIQVAINTVVADGGVIFIKAGDYEISSRIVIYNKQNITICGEGVATRLYASGGFVDSAILFFNLCNNIVVSNLQIDGMKSTLSYAGDPWKQHGIFLYRTTNGRIEHNYVHDCYGTGILIKKCEYIRINDNYVVNNGASDHVISNGITDYGGSKYVWIINNHVKNSYRINISSRSLLSDFSEHVFICNNICNGTIDSTDHTNLLVFEVNKAIIDGNIVLNTASSTGTASALRAETGNGVIITNNIVIGGNVANAIHAYNSIESVEISNNIIYDSPNHGIVVAKYDLAIIKGNIIRNTANDAILSTTSGGKLIVTDNLIYNSYRPIKIDSTTNNVTVINNQFYNYTNAPIISASTKIVRNNLGFATENSGTTTFSGTSVSFTHGLAGTPTQVFASFNSTGYGGWTWTANSTHITITVANSGSYTVYWRAYYEP